MLISHALYISLLTTFHSFAADLLRQHEHLIGLSPYFTVMEQDSDRHSLLYDAIEQINEGKINLTSEELLPLISRLVEQNISDVKITETLKQQPFDNPHEHALIYQRNRFLLIERNVQDFVGLIAEAIQLLEFLLGARKQIQRIFCFSNSNAFPDSFFDLNSS